MMLPTDIANHLEALKVTGRLSEWFVIEDDMGREWFLTLSGSKTLVKFTRREVEAFLLGASLSRNAGVL